MHFATVNARLRKLCGKRIQKQVELPRPIEWVPHRLDCVRPHGGDAFVQTAKELVAAEAAGAGLSWV